MELTCVVFKNQLTKRPNERANYLDILITSDKKLIIGNTCAPALLINISHNACIK